MKKHMNYILLICLTLVASVANASHFRGGAANASVDANGLLTLNQTSFWRKGASYDQKRFYITGANTNNSIVTGDTANTSDARFDVFQVQQLFNYLVLVYTTHVVVSAEG